MVIFHLDWDNSLNEKSYNINALIIIKFFFHESPINLILKPKLFILMSSFGVMLN